MSEYPIDRPNVPLLHWCDGGAPNTKTEPAEGKKDTGWAYKDKPPYDEFNWRWYLIYQVLSWLDGGHVREFSTLAEAIATIAIPRCFRVRPPVAGMRARLEQLFSTEGDGGAVTIIAVRTDGERIYYAQGNDIYAASPADLAQDWTQAKATNNIIDVAADGLNVYVLHGYHASENEIFLLDPSDGSENAAVALASPSGTALRANGAYLVVIQGQYARVYSGISGTPNYDGQADHTAAIAALALDETHAYIGGTQGTDSKDVRAVKLSDRSITWSVTLPTTSAATVYGIATDGERVYVTTNWAALSGGGNASIFCLNAWDGTLLWTYDTSCDLEEVVVDDRYLYVTKRTGATLNMYMFEKAAGIVVDYSTVSVRAGGCDGLSVVGDDGANNVRRHWRGNATRMFMRAAGDDPNRRPFHTLAIPLDEGV